MRPTAISCKLLGLAAAATLAAASAPAFSADATGDLAITSKAAGRDGRSVSASIDVRDLDLSTASGRRELSVRVRRTAKALCGRFHEGPTDSAWVGFACEDDAVASAGDLQQAATRPPAPSTYVTAAAGQR
jgi:UrcA family protein